MTKFLNPPQGKPLLSDEHFSVDGTLIAAGASPKSFRAKDGGDKEGDGAYFRGQTRSNETHAGTTDPESRLNRKAAGREARLCSMGHVAMENRHGLAVAGGVTKADGPAKRRASQAMLKPSARPLVGAARPARTRPMIRRAMWKTCVPSTSRRMWRRTMARPKSASGGEARSMPARQGTRARACRRSAAKGSQASLAGASSMAMRKAKQRGVARIAGGFLLHLIAGNLIRIPKLVAA